jgi:hypothetical protein
MQLQSVPCSYTLNPAVTVTIPGYRPNLFSSGRVIGGAGGGGGSDYKCEGLVACT